MHVFDVLASRILNSFNRNRFSDDYCERPSIRNDAIIVLEDSATEENCWRKSPKAFNKFLKSAKLRACNYINESCVLKFSENRINNLVQILDFKRYVLVSGISDYECIKSS
jgi:hypothetical protein